MKFKDIAFEIAGKTIAGVAESLGKSFGHNVFGVSHSSKQDGAIVQALSSNNTALETIAKGQIALAEVQRQQNEVKQAELQLNAMIAGENATLQREKLALARQAHQENLAQQASLARQERELKVQLSEQWCNLKRELQHNDLQSREQLQTQQIQADWDNIKLPTIFSRQELETLAQDTEHPLFVCAKMQITEGCPNYFKTELTAEAESQIKKFANSVFRGDVRFYSRFFDDENIFDTNAAQLRSIIPDVPCVMSFSKVTRRSAFFHYQLWGSRSAEILHGHFDVELPWRDVAQQLRNQSEGAVLDEDDLHETIGDWLTTLQKIYAAFFVDLYAIVDGNDPFYATKLESINVNLPSDLASQYIQPLSDILQRIQTERIEAFHELLRRQRDEASQQARRQKAQEVQAEQKRKAEWNVENVALESERKGTDYTKLRDLLKTQKWKEADQETYRLMITIVGRTEGDYFRQEDLLNFPCKDLKTIDRLWVQASQGRYGFSVQKEFYVRCGAKLDGNYPGSEIWEKFGTEVGWRVNNSWKNYNDLTWNSMGVRGHLPVGFAGCCGWFGVGVFVVGLGWVGFFSRIKTCEV